MADVDAHAAMEAELPPFVPFPAAPWHARGLGIASTLQESRQEPAAEGTASRVHGGIVLRPLRAVRHCCIIQP